MTQPSDSRSQSRSLSRSPGNTVLITLLAFAIVLPSIATAERHFSAKRLDRLLERAAAMDIDPEIRDQIRDLYAQHRADTNTRREALHVAHRDLDALLEGDPVDRSAIDAKLNEIGALRTELLKAKIGLQLSIRASLTPEQQRALGSVLEHRDGRHKMRRAHRRQHFRERRGDG